MGIYTLLSTINNYTDIAWNGLGSVKNSTFSAIGDQLQPGVKSALVEAANTIHASVTYTFFKEYSIPFLGVYGVCVGVSLQGMKPPIALIPLTIAANVIDRKEEFAILAITTVGAYLLTANFGNLMDKAISILETLETKYSDAELKNSTLKDNKLYVNLNDNQNAGKNDGSKK